MKRLLILALLGLTTMSFRFQGTPAIITALKSANAESVSAYFDNFIDLKLPEKDEIKNMGKTQSGLALQSFYRDNNIKGFTLTSQREMGGTTYVAGKLDNGAKGFNITLLIKNKDGGQQIITVRIN